VTGTLAFPLPHTAALLDIGFGRTANEGPCQYPEEKLLKMKSGARHLCVTYLVPVTLAFPQFNPFGKK
jgi:hypothetical protein